MANRVVTAAVKHRIYTGLKTTPAYLLGLFMTVTAVINQDEITQNNVCIYKAKAVNNG